MNTTYLSIILPHNKNKTAAKSADRNRPAIMNTLNFSIVHCGSDSFPQSASVASPAPHADETPGATIAQKELSAVERDPGVLGLAVELGQMADDVIEVAQRTNMGIEEIAAGILPLFRRKLFVNGIFLFCRNEELDFTIFSHCDANDSTLEECLPSRVTELLNFVASCNGHRFKGRAMPSILEQPPLYHQDSAQVEGVAQCPGRTASLEEKGRIWDLVVLDIDSIPVGVLGVWFGANENHDSHETGEFCFSNHQDPSDRLFILRFFTEVMDNFIYAENLSRLKQVVQNRLGAALKNRILNDGLTEALLILREHIDFDSLLIMYHDEEDPELTSLKYILYSHEQGLFDPYGNFDPKVHRLILEKGREILQGETRSLRELVVLQGFQDEFLIAGLEKQRSIGKLMISSRDTSFDRFERDLLEIFVSFVRQRVVDFNKEWRNLSKFFSVEHRTRLLSITDYASRFLAPRDRNVAILYADIASFTMISEKILCDPFLISEMIDIWSRGCLSIIWEHGGCFDKLVGDCVIALFGPPFHEMSPQECCLRTLQAASAIRDFTLSLYHHPAPCFQKLRESADISEFNVATGVNHAPLFVGMNGPNSDFTGFSSGMNNTARIQSVARSGEILVLSGCHQRVADLEGVSFAGPMEANLKNVSGMVPYWRLEKVPARASRRNP